MAKQGEASLLLKIKTTGEEALSKVREGLSTVATAAAAAGGGIIAFATK